MNARRRAILFAAFAITLRAGGALAFDTETQTLLAPGKALKSGLYPGTPTSILPASDPAKSVGVGLELGRELAARLGIPYEPVVFPKNADVLDAIKAGKVDTVFTNASPARAKEMNFGPPYLDIELGYLVPSNGRITAITGVDVAGRRIGVTAGSSSEAVLSKDLKNAEVVRAETIEIAIGMLASGGLDAFATNKATLFEMSEKLSGSRVLEGSWGLERHAIAIPKGREKGLDFIRDFTREAKANGFVQGAIQRSGLRGAVVAPAE
jgi:polar amino acid transport system substrate-binding protein